MQVVNIERDVTQKIRGATRYRVWFEHEGAVWFKYLEEQDVNDATTRVDFKNWLNSVIEDTVNHVKPKAGKAKSV